MRVGIQILNYNGMRWLPGLLSSLKENKSGDQIVYVVDNASSDDSLQYVASEHPDVRIIWFGENLGYGGAYSRSIPQAFADGCDWVCLQNSDTLVTPGWLQRIEVAAQRDSSIGVMGPVFWEWESERPNYYMEGRCKDIIPFMLDATRAPVDRDWVEGSSFFIRRECYEQLGGFDPLYFMYWEDAEYCRRARLQGWRVVVVPGSVCRHFAGGSAAQAGRSFDQIRNHYLYKLSDPSQSFLLNMASSTRLAATYLKQSVWDSPNASQAVRILHASISAAGKTRRCYQSRAKTLSP